MKRSAACCFLLLFTACDCTNEPETPPDSGGQTPPDAGSTDSGSTDAGLRDASRDAAADSGADAGVDAGAPDVGMMATLDIHAISPTFGPRGGGTTVTVLGAGFVAGQTTAQIGLTPLTDVVVVNERMLRGVTSSFTGDTVHPVSVTNGTAQATLDGAFFVGGWEYANEGLPRGFTADGMFVDPTNSDVLYMIDDGKLIKSFDRGLTWVPANWDVFSAGAASLVIDAADPLRLSMDTQRDVMISDNGGASWELAPAGRLNDYYEPLIAEWTNPDYQFIFNRRAMGNYQGFLNILRTDDFWATRSACRDGGLSLVTFPSVGAFEVALDDETVVAHLNATVYRSVPPGCDNWVEAGANLIGSPHVMKRPYGSPVFYALTNDGLYSAPGPSDPWTRIGEPFPGLAQYMWVVETTPVRVYAAEFTREPPIWFKSDGGGPWTELAVPTRGAIAIDPQEQTTIYTAGLEGAFKSEDGGDNWTLLTPTMRSGGAEMLAASPREANLLLAATTRNIYYTTDGGASWMLTNATFTADIEELEYAPHTSSTAYAASGRELLKTTDGGVSWTNITPPGSSSVGEIALDPSTPDRIYVDGIQLRRSDNGGVDWETLEHPSLYVYELLVDPVVPLTLYASTSADGVMRSLDGGETWAPVNNGLSGPQVGVLSIDPTLSGVLFASVPTSGGAHDFFKSTNGGDSWEVMPVGTVDTPRAIVADPNDSDNIYVGAAFRVLMSDDGGRSWTQINPGSIAGHQPAQVPTGLVSDIVFAATPGTFYVSGTRVAGTVLKFSL